MNNKEKNARVVKFKEDYFSKPGKEKGEVIYRKGETHAIHKNLVAKLEKAGAKMEVKEVDVDAQVARLKKRRADNLKKAASV